jgi:hypothetical protein
MYWKNPPRHISYFGQYNSCRNCVYMSTASIVQYNDVYTVTVTVQCAYTQVVLQFQEAQAHNTDTTR